MTLNSINSPDDLKKLSREELPALADELRQFVLESVSKTGGHLSSNLGTVELSIALHYVFDTPRDRIVWDVGHQSYPHKILTGRRERMSTLRQFRGLSGFPHRADRASARRAAARARRRRTGTASRRPGSGRCRAGRGW